MSVSVRSANAAEEERGWGMALVDCDEMVKGERWKVKGGRNKKKASVS